MGLEKSNRSSINEKKEIDQSLLNIKNVMQKINTHLNAAQIHLLSESEKMIDQIDSKGFTLPTAYRQHITADGKNEIEKISEVFVPLSSIVPPGIFRISQVDVELPISLYFEDISPDKKSNVRKNSQKKEGETQAVLRLKYDYQQLTNIISPVTLKPTLVMELEFLNYTQVTSNKCKAKGRINVYEIEKTNPIQKERIYLSIENGTITPAEGELDENGSMTFRIVCPCKKGGVLDTSILALVGSVTRKFIVHLSP